MSERMYTQKEIAGILSVPIADVNQAVSRFNVPSTKMKRDNYTMKLWSVKAVAGALLKLYHAKYNACAEKAMSWKDRGAGVRTAYTAFVEGDRDGAGQQEPET